MLPGIRCVLLAAVFVCCSAKTETSSSNLHSSSIFGVRHILGSFQEIVSSHAEELQSLSRNFRASEVVEGTKTLIRGFTGQTRGIFAPKNTQQRFSVAKGTQGTVQHRELDAVLGSKRDHAAQQFTRRVLAQPSHPGSSAEIDPHGIAHLTRKSLHALKVSGARKLQTTSAPQQVIDSPGDPECSHVGRRVQVRSTTDECAGVPVTTAQRATITAGVQTINNANLDAATRTAATTTVTAVPGVGNAVFNAAVDANTPLPAGFNINSALTPAQVAVVVAAANVSSAANITTFAQLAPVVSTNASAAGNSSIPAGQLLLALPFNATAALVGGVTCTQVESFAPTCLCPVDYTGGSNCTAKAWGCSLQWNEPQVDSCIASNAALPGLDFSVDPPAPLSRVAELEYSTVAFGLPPCAFYSASQQSLLVKLQSTCAYRSDARAAQPSPVFTCNGTVMDAAFFGGEAALDSSPLQASQAPFFGFNCTESRFNYSTGGPFAVNWGARLPTNVTAQQLPLRMPFSLSALHPDDAQRVHVGGRLSAVDWQVLSDTSAGVNVSMPLGLWNTQALQAGGAADTGTRVSVSGTDAELRYTSTGALQVAMNASLPSSSFSGRFAVGGRALVYGQLSRRRAAQGGPARVAVATFNGTAPLKRAVFQAAVVGPFVFDERTYVEPQAEKPSVLVAVLVPTLLVLLAAAGGFALWRHRKNKAAADKEQLEREGFGLFSGEHDDVAAARRQAALQEGAADEKPLLDNEFASDSKRSPPADSKVAPSKITPK